MSEKISFTLKAEEPPAIEWYTPPIVFTKLGTTFDLDPASPGKEETPWIPARRFLTIKDDGLCGNWSGRVWLNPPYTKFMIDWLLKLADHGDGIALTFARTDTRWFHEIAPRASLICLAKGRIEFISGSDKEGDRPNAPSVFFAFGDSCKEILLKSNLGICFNPMRR